MRRYLKAMWDNVQRGTGASLRSLVTGMFAAFAISLPVTIILHLITASQSVVIYVITGAVHALATFCVAGWKEKTG